MCDPNFTVQFLASGKVLNTRANFAVKALTTHTDGNGDRIRDGET